MFRLDLKSSVKGVALSLLPPSVEPTASLFSFRFISL